MSLFGLGNRSQQPNLLGSIQIGTSEYGVARPIGWGRFKAPIKLLDYQDFTGVGQSSGGGKGGGGITSYEYYAAVDMLVCAGPVGGYGNLYDSGGGGTLQVATDTYTIPAGGGSFQVEQGVAAFYYDEGVTYDVDYSLAANDFGSDGDVTLSGTQPAPFERITSGAIGLHEYTVGTTGRYTFGAADAGKTISITYTYTTADTSNGAISVGNDPRAPLLKWNIASILGTTPQSPWDYMLTKHPANALRYDGLARIVCSSLDLGSNASVPSLSVEVINGRLRAFGNGVSDCDPSAIITDLLTDAVAGCNWPYLGDLTNYSNFCVANNLFMSLFIDSTRKVTEIVQEICDLTNSAPVWSGNALKIIPYGDTSAVGNGRTYTPQTEPIYQIDEDELLSGDGEEAVKIAWRDLADNYNRVQYEYVSRNDNYNTALIHEQDEASILANGLLPMKTVSAHHFCVQLYAAISMNMTLRRNSTALREYEFTLPWYYQLLEPMDIVQLNLTLAALGLKAIRLVSIEEQEDYSLKVVAEDFLWGVAQGVVYPKGTSVGSVPGAHNEPGDTILLSAYQPGIRCTGGGAELWLALNGGTNWGGCNIHMSLDGSTYSLIGTQYGGARGGTITSNLPATADPDTTDTLAVTVTGDLSTVTAVQANAFATLSLVGNELIAYETAAITASTATTNSYALTMLRRGVFNTAIAAHAAGEQFVRLDGQVFKYVLDPTLFDKTIWLKFTSFNLVDQEEQLITGVNATSVYLDVVTYPPPPVVTVTQSATNPGGSGSSATASAGVTVTSTGATVAGIVWLTIAWTWPSGYPASTGFEVVAFAASDPTVTANYLFPITTVPATTRTYTVAVTPTSNMATVNAAVRAIYA